MKKILSFIALICGLIFSVHVSAQKLPFQGRLLQDQQPVNATLDMVFSIDSVSWTETHTGVVVSNGLYSVVLGDINPLPVDLFNGFSEHQLKITIGGTALTPVKIYPAIAKGSGGIGTRYSTTGATTKGDTAVFYSIDGGADSLQYFALRTTAQTLGSNVGSYSRAISATGSEWYQVGAWGRAAGEGTAYHYGVIGQANSVGVSNLGVYGSASGAGNGYQGYDSGSYNTGVNGYATGNSWGNTGVFGNATGTQGVDNIGVVGWSSVGADTTENKGVLGWARGVGVNKGVMGMATGGVENWAGWFEGNTHIQGKYIHARVDSISLDDVNGRQAIVLESMFGGSPTAFIGGYGPNGKGNFYLSSGGHNRSYGNLTLKDSIGVTKAWLSAYHLSDGRAYGLMSLYGPDQKGWIGAGFKGWQADTLANLPYIHLEGNIPNVPLVNAEVNSNGSGVEEGHLTLKTIQDGRFISVNSSEMIFHGPNKPNIQIGAKVWENSDLASISLKDSTWGNLAVIESLSDANGFSGTASFHTTQDARLARISSKGINLDGPNNPIVNIGMQDWNNPNLGFIHIYDTAFSPMAEVQVDYNGSFQQGVIRLKTNQDNKNASFSADRIALNGPTSGNVEINHVYWDLARAGADRGFINIYNSVGTPMIHMRSEHNGVTESGFVEVTGGGGYIHLQSLKDTIAVVTVSDGTNNLELRGNGDIYANGLYYSSDSRYKNNIETLSGALDKTLRLKGVSYYWNEKSKGAGKQIGLIAQEVEAVYPEFVSTNTEGYKTVNYAQMVAVLIEAVKELNTKVETLEKDNNRLNTENNDLKAQLEGQMNDLKNRLDQFEKLLPAVTSQNSSSNSGSK